MLIVRFLRVALAGFTFPRLQSISQVVKMLTNCSTMQLQREKTTLIDSAERQMLMSID